MMMPSWYLPQAILVTKATNRPSQNLDWERMPFK